MLHGIAYGYGVELDSVKVAKAEAFCKGVIDELALRGVLTNSSSNNSAKDSSAVDAAGTAAAAAAAGAEGETPQAGSQGSDVSNVSDDTQVVLDCASQTGPPEPAAAAAGKQADQPTGAAAASAGAQKAAPPPAAAAAANGKKAAAKLKGEALLWPASRPIITCAAVEQVSCLCALFLTSPHPPLCQLAVAPAVFWCLSIACVCVPTRMVGCLLVPHPPTCAAPWCDMLCRADTDRQPGPWHPCLLLLGGCASQWQAGLWAAVQDKQDNEGVQPSCGLRFQGLGFMDREVNAVVRTSQGLRWWGGGIWGYGPGPAGQ